MCIYHNFPCPLLPLTEGGLRNPAQNPLALTPKLIHYFSSRESLWLIRQRCEAKRADYAFSDTTVLCPFTTVWHNDYFEDGNEKVGTQTECERCNTLIQERDWLGLKISAIKYQERIPQMTVDIYGEIKECFLGVELVSQTDLDRALKASEIDAMAELIQLSQNSLPNLDPETPHALRDGSFSTALECFSKSSQFSSTIIASPTSPISQTVDTDFQFSHSRKRTSTALSSTTDITSDEEYRDSIKRLRKDKASLNDQIAMLLENKAQHEQREAQLRKELSREIEKVNQLEEEKRQLVLKLSMNENCIEKRSDQNDGETDGESDAKM